MKIKKLIADIGKTYPTLWKYIDQIREQNSYWPNNVFVPAMVIDFLTNGKDGMFLAALASWRVGQGVYRFDEQIFQELIDTQIENIIPTDVLLRLPEWCIYIELPENFKTYCGVCVYLDYDLFSKKQKLNFLFEFRLNNKKLDWLPVSLTIDNDLNIQESLLKMFECWKHAIELQERDNPTQTLSYLTIANEFYSDLQEAIPQVLSLVMYICSKNAEISETPDKPNPTKTKNGLRYFPPDKEKVYNVGVRYGEFIRNHKKYNYETSESTGRSVSPHLRRAHWHGYWTGSKTDSNRQFILKWLPPIKVGYEENMPITIKKIKDFSKAA